MSKMMDKMIMLGAVQVVGVNEDGQFRYSLNGTIEDIMPELYRVHIDEVHDTVMHFWELGYVEFMDMDRAAPKIKLTQKVLDKDAVDSLDEEDREALFNLMQIFRKN